MDIDIRSAFHAVLINRSSNVVVVPSIEIDSMDVYIVQAEDGESGATLNLWACLGSQNDEEATTMLSTIQQSINRVIGQSPTTTTTKPDVSSSPSSVTEEGKEENQRIPYKIHLSRFSLRQLTLHAPLGVFDHSVRERVHGPSKVFQRGYHDPVELIGYRTSSCRSQQCISFR